MRANHRHHVSVSGDTALQLGLALLCVVLSATAWLVVLDSLVLGW